MRFYSFVAGLYLSELQKGLQTGHAISEVTATYDLDSPEFKDYHEWAIHHKTIIILNALNHGGVKDVFSKIQPLGNELKLPTVIFHEDEVSMNGMATATGIVVPQQLYDVHKEYAVAPHVNAVHYLSPIHAVPTDANSYWVHVKADGSRVEYHPGSPEYELIEVLKAYRLA